MNTAACPVVRFCRSGGPCWTRRSHHSLPPPADMTWKALICIISFFGSAPFLLGSAFEDGNQQFAAGDFAGAAKSYEKILADDGPDAAVFYNLGNSYQSLKKYGPAILAYERAKLLGARDPDLLANLALARKAATAFEDAGKYPRLEAAMDRLSRNEWSWLVAGGALVLGCMVLLRGAVDVPKRWMRHAGGVVCILAVTGIVLGSVALWLRRGEGARGVVLVENAAVRLSPFEKAESLGTSIPGRIVRLGERNGEFYYAEVPGTNLNGWLANSDVALIVDEAGPD